MEYMENKMQEQYDAQNELIKEISRLQDLLAKHGICDDCGELYNHHFDEPLASCGCKQSEWYELTPHMKQVLELKTECDALTAQVESCNDALKSLLKTPLGIGGSLQSDGQFYYKVPESVFKKAESTLAKTPQQCLREIEAEAGRKGFIAGFNESGEGFNGEWGASDKRISALASEYAEKLRQGGAE